MGECPPPGGAPSASLALTLAAPAACEHCAGKVLVMHGGLFSRDDVTLDEIRKIDRFRCDVVKGRARYQSVLGVRCSIVQGKMSQCAGSEV